MSTEPASELAVEPDLGFGPAEARPTAGVGPGKLALRRLRRNRVALAFGALFLVLVAIALAAPAWKHVAKTDPYENHVSDKVTVGGKKKDVVSVQGVPIGPTWHTKFF